MPQNLPNFLDPEKQSPIQSPISQESALKKTLTPKFIIVLMAILVVGGGIYGYVTYLTWQNYDNVAMVAQDGQKGSNTPEKARLAEVELRGGLCVEKGICKTVLVIDKSGEVSIDGTSVMILSSSELSRLVQQINETDFKSVKERFFEGTCPMAYDGQETVYRIYIAGEVEELPNCTYEIDVTSGLFMNLRGILIKGLELRPEVPDAMDMTGWQTYRNEEYGFEFKYPGQWEVKINLGDDPYRGSYISTVSLVIIPTKVDSSGYCLSAEQYARQYVVDFLSAEQALRERLKYKIEEVGDNVKSPYDIWAYTRKLDHPFGQTTYQAVISDLDCKNPYVYLFIDGEKGGDLNKLNQILSTFKFLDN